MKIKPITILLFFLLCIPIPFNDLIEIYHAQVNGDYKQMLELAQTVRNTQDRYLFISHAYEWLGDWKKSLQLNIKH